MQSYLTNLDQSNRCIGNIDDVVIQDVFICVDKKGILSGWRYQHNRRGQLLGMHNMIVIESLLTRVDSNLKCER